MIGLDVFLYVALTAIPGGLLIMALLQTYNIAYVPVLAALLAITIFSVAVKIKRGNKPSTYYPPTFRGTLQFHLVA